MAHIKEANNHEAICKACDTTFKNFDNMRHHKRKYHFDKSAISEFVCDGCGMSFKTRDLRKNHWDYVHKIESDLNCNLCGKLCQNMMKLKKHTIICLARDPDIVAQERLQFEATLSTKYQTLGYEANTSGVGTKSTESEEKEELNKMNELESIVKIKTEPDIEELVAPLKR